MHMHPDAFRNTEDFFQEDGKISFYYPQQQLYKVIKTTFSFQINMICEDGTRENSHRQKADSLVLRELYFLARTDLVQSDKNHTLPKYCMDQKFCSVHFCVLFVWDFLPFLFAWWWLLFFLLIYNTLMYWETGLGSFIKTNNGGN